MLLEGDIYVSSVKGHIVGRPGSGSANVKPQWIGAYPIFKTLPDGRLELEGLEWREDEVHLIPAADVQTHLKAYSTEIAAGGLKLRTKKDFETFCKAQEEASAKDAQPKSEVSSEDVPGTLEEGGAPLELGEQIAPGEPAPDAQPLPATGDEAPSPAPEEPAPAQTPPERIKKRGSER